MELSVCIPSLNRNRIPWQGRMLELLPRCLDSLARALDAACVEAEVIIADGGSEDWPPAEWAPQRIAPMPVRVLDAGRPFMRGRARNVAAEAARSDVLFFCDADMLVPARVIERGLEVAAGGRGYFPLYKRFSGPEHTSQVPGSGHGNCVVLAAHWRASRWPERLRWGGEDTAFARWFSARGLMVREAVPGFVHQWHPKGGAADGH